MGKILVTIMAIIGMIALAAGVGLLLAFPVMWCWNYAVVATFGLPKITWGMAWCLNLLFHFFIKTNVTVNKS